MKPFSSLFRPVLTLSRAQFQEVCGSLGDRIVELCSPDLIVVVPRAGDFIWEELKKIPVFEGVNVVKIKAQRRLTKHKSKGFIKPVLVKFPRSINNLLRHLESIVRELMFYLRGPGVSPLLEYEDGVVDCVVKAKRIVVIDDAIDSGVSIKSILEFLKQKNALATIHVAVITTTFEEPLVCADISLYDRQIIRFHWAEDYDAPKN